MASGNVKEIVKRIIGERSCIKTGEVAKAAGITRQAAHRQLRQMVRDGILNRTGRGRGACYIPAGLSTPGEKAPGNRDDEPRFTFELERLEEDKAFKQIEKSLPPALGDTDRNIFRYAFMEILNNAIEHSGGRKAEVIIESGGQPAFEIIDDGVGIFEHLRRSLGLASHQEALCELSKGKLTTAPERHTGEGIFFVSKAATRFEIESGSLRWLVDNQLPDQAIMEAPPRPGTRVRVEIAPGWQRPLEELFAEYTRDFRFTRTRTVVKLFAYGVSFVSRSEARRLVKNLEKFTEVVLDFTGVQGVGQGFADEVFRVWARAHPQVRLIPINMNAPVEFMVNRALRLAGE